VIPDLDASVERLARIADGLERLAQGLPAASAPPRRLLRVREAAAQLATNERRVRALLKAGELEAFSHADGGDTLVTQRSVDAYVQRRLAALAAPLLGGRRKAGAR